MNKALRLIDYLDHICEAIDRIQRYTDTLTAADFHENSLIQDAVIRNLEIIGEASHNIIRYAEDFVKSNPDLPLLFAYRLRNILSHGYFAIDLEIVWATVQRDLPPLRRRLEQIRATRVSS